MTTPTITPYHSDLRVGRDGFAQLVRAEWTKFRTVRGWLIGMAVAALLLVLLGVVSAAGSNNSCGTITPQGQQTNQSGRACFNAPTLGPDGEPVDDSMYFVHQPMLGDGNITVRLTSLTGLYPPNSNAAPASGQGPQMVPGVLPWSKAGIIIKENTRQGSAYAAMMATGGHGVRMQYDYTHDTAGISGAAAAASPQWLRLTRSGDTVTGYDSVDGTHWTEVGTAVLAGLSSTAQAGMFAASPDYTVTTQSFGGSSSTGGPSQATGVFDHVSLQGAGSSGTWTGDALGEAGQVGGPGAGLQAGLQAGFQQAAGEFSVSGSGDIAPVVEGPGGGGGASRTIEQSLVGAFAGLIAVIVVATMFMTAEYRRGLIRTTLVASPRRGRVLAAKAVVIGSVTFVAALVAAAVAVPLVGRLESDNGFYVYSVSSLTELRVIVGTAALLAVAAVLALAVGTVLRRGAGAVTVVIAAIVLPYILAVASVLPAGASDWLLRLTPAAAFAVQQTVTQYPQVTASYTPNAGYFPLAPWAGFAVLCGYAALALGLAAFVLRRRDA